MGGCGGTKVKRAAATDVWPWWKTTRARTGPAELSGVDLSGWAGEAGLQAKPFPAERQVLLPSWVSSPPALSSQSGMGAGKAQFFYFVSESVNSS